MEAQGYRGRRLLLGKIVDEKFADPAEILGELNRRVKETLHHNDPDLVSDDGLDIGICYIERNTRVVFAGAKIALYVRRGNQVQSIKGKNTSIGYRSSSSKMEFVNETWEVEAGDVFYLTTDGYLDQNGGEKDYPLGKKRFMQIIGSQGEKRMAEQKEAFEKALGQYMGNEPQRDDITVLGFSLSVILSA